jgi:cytoskeletal protein CcmA (bactofilin family)
MAEPVTNIGRATVVKGKLEGDENLVVEGRIEGSIGLSKTLTIETSGVVQAEISVQQAIIRGVLVGNVQAAELVNITEEGRVVGDIKAPRVILVDGASFRGNIDMGEFDKGE